MAAETPTKYGNFLTSRSKQRPHGEESTSKFSASGKSFNLGVTGDLSEIKRMNRGEDFLI